MALPAVQDRLTRFARDKLMLEACMWKVSEQQGSPAHHVTACFHAHASVDDLPSELECTKNQR